MTAWSEPRVTRVRPGQVRIEGGNLLAIRAWLGRQRSVTAVGERAEQLDVQYTELPNDRDALLRGLRDRVARASGVRPKVAVALVMMHRTANRMRIELKHATDEDVARLSAWFVTQPGVLRAHPSLVTQTIVVSLDETKTTPEALVLAAKATSAAAWPAAQVDVAKSDWAGLAFNTAVLGASFTGLLPAPVIGLAVALTALPSAKRAATAIGERRLSVDTLDLAAIGISIATGRPQTGAFVTWLLGIGDLALSRASKRARHAISNVMKLDTTDAWRIGPNEVAEQVPVAKLVVGDRIIVTAGASVAADGIILSGEISVDEKALTGESAPQLRTSGDAILAASIVVQGQAILQLQRVGSDTKAAKIVQILEGAGAKPMSLQRGAERVADRLVLPTFGVAGLAALLTSQIDRATSVLITDFGTGIRIAIPTSALVGITVAARHGVLVKGGQFLERLACADVVVFDKTGTLTTGAPRVVESKTFGQRSLRDVLSLVAAAESHQHHPIAEALCQAARDAHATILHAQSGSEKVFVGRGVEAQVGKHTVLIGSPRLMRERGFAVDSVLCTHHAEMGAATLLVAIDGVLHASFALADTPRREAREVVQALRAGGKRRVVIMSGDAHASVRAVAHAVGADEAWGELLPEGKADRIVALQKAGRVVAMVGDGINDAPALALADVGISIDGGTDVALETADVVLLEGGLTKLPFAFVTAEKTMREVRRGLGLIIAPNAVAIGLGALGLLAPGAAAIINNGSTVAAALLALTPLLRAPRRESHARVTVPKKVQNT